MKRHRAGSYSSLNQRFYAVRMENGWWTVGEKTVNGDYEQIEDFKTYREARQFVKRKEVEILEKSSS